MKIVWLVVFCLVAAAATAQVKKGMLSPDFKGMDMQGRPVSVKDLKGKYVYIDVWATWCEPCRKEMPYLKELQKKFKDRQIVFVGLSCERNAGKWGNMVKAEQLGGIQLTTFGDRSFMEAYQIEGIPRFILLDKEGKILDSNMSRPSDPRTVEKLMALKGI